MDESLVKKGVGGFIKMTIGVSPKGQIRIGNDSHCVVRRMRPPLGPDSGKLHPGDLLEKDDLMDLAAQLNERLAARGITTSQITFVEKTSMPRAQAE